MDEVFSRQTRRFPQPYSRMARETDAVWRKMMSLFPYVLMVPATENFTSCILNQKIGCTIIRIINQNL